MPDPGAFDLADPPREIVFEVDGLPVGALEWGPRDGRPALLVHGFPDTAWTWRHLGPQLGEAGWRAVAPFSRGYGPTGLAPNGRYLVSDLLGDAVAIAERLSGEGPDDPVLIGHDWGAVIAWAAAARCPDAFASLVAMAVPPPAVIRDVWSSPSTVPTGLAQLRLSWYFLFNQSRLAEHHFDRLVGRLWRDWSPGYRGESDVAAVLASLDTPERIEAALAYYRDNLRRGVRYLAGLEPSVPVLYLHGEDDGCGRIALARAGARKMGPGSRFEELAGVGHFLELEDPDRVAELVLDWIGENGQGA